MTKYDLKLRPIHYACVSGGKDSLYMLNLILNNLDKYPLDMVVHYDMELDWEWTKEVIDFMEQRCTEAGLKFVRIKPEHDWNYWYKKWGFPNRQSRWCNSRLKMNCVSQITKWIKEQNCRPIAYIGFCADETKRFKYNIDDEMWQFQDVCYPLAEEGIEEWEILEWARKTPIFHDWYKYFNRQGCMMCPMLSMKEKAYMFKYYPLKYAQYMNYIKESEERFNYEFFQEPLENHRKKIETKWLNILNAEEQFEQLSIFDFSDGLYKAESEDRE